MVNVSVIVYVTIVCAIAAIGRTTRESVHGSDARTSTRRDDRSTSSNGTDGERAAENVVLSEEERNSTFNEIVAEHERATSNRTHDRTEYEQSSEYRVSGVLFERMFSNRTNDDDDDTVSERASVDRVENNGTSTDQTIGAFFGLLFSNRTNDVLNEHERFHENRTDVGNVTKGTPSERSVDDGSTSNRNENVLKVKVIFSDAKLANEKSNVSDCRNCDAEKNRTEGVDCRTCTEDTNGTTDRYDGSSAIAEEDTTKRVVMSGSKQLPLTHPNELLVDSAEQLIMSQGYLAESHQVETEDGYLLRIHRVPYGRKAHKIKNKRGRRPVVLVHHGLLSSSDIFLLRSADKDIGYLLAERGYDVWFANSRGNTYSRKHVSMSASDASFWAFGLHEIGYYDLPAVVDYVLDVTGNRDLFFVGHSMGATISYILCSTRPEYNDKFRLILSLAPVVYLKPKTLFLNLLSNSIAYFKEIMYRRGMFELLPQTPFSARLGRALCHDGAMTQSLCLTMIFIMAGVDYEQMNTTLLPKVLAHYPAGTSWQVLMHFHQFILTGEFAQWNYGEVENMKRYHQPKPPLYDFDKVTAPISIHYGENDFLAPPEDIMKLALKIPNLVGTFKVPHSMFNHLDFLWAKDGRQLLYDFLISLMDKYR